MTSASAKSKRPTASAPPAPVFGTRGNQRVDPAFEYDEGLAHYLTLNGRTTRKPFNRCDQFAPEIIYFSDFVKRNKDPEPGGLEGLNDVRIIEAIEESAKRGGRVALSLEADRPPSPRQTIRKPPVKSRPLVRASGAQRD